MDAKSNLYCLCFTYNCAATCVYKAVLILDILAGLGIFLQSVSLIFATSFKGLYAWALLAAGCFMLYIAFLAVKLLIAFNENLSTATIHPKTDEYLKIRIYFVYAWFVLAVLFPVLFIITCLIMFGTKLGWGYILTPALSYLITYGIQGWAEYTFQKSLTEANDVLGGTTTSLQKHQTF